MWWWMQSLSNRYIFYFVVSVVVFFISTMTISFPPSDRLLLSGLATSFPFVRKLQSAPSLCNRSVRGLRCRLYLTAAAELWLSWGPS